MPAPEIRFERLGWRRQELLTDIPGLHERSRRRDDNFKRSEFREGLPLKMGGAWPWPCWSGKGAASFQSLTPAAEWLSSWTLESSALSADGATG